LPPCRCRSAT